MAQNGQADRQRDFTGSTHDTSGGEGREGWSRVIVEEVKRVRDLRRLALLRSPLSAKLNPLAQGSPASRQPLQLARARQHYTTFVLPFRPRRSNFPRPRGDMGLRGWDGMARCGRRVAAQMNKLS